MPSSKKRKIFRYFLLIFWGSVFSWQFFQMNARGFDKASILSSNQDVVFSETEEYLSFSPKVDSVLASVLFFPGALVQPEVYAPLAKNLAHQGYSVHIQKIPFRVAITDNMEKKAFRNASSFMNSSSKENWIVAGHSRGGRMAANFASQYSEILSGMILLGTSHPKEKNLTTLLIPVLKISASEDGLASPPEIEQFSHNLPSATNFVMIDGGNHSQFGYYGFQFGSGSALISRKKQQEIVESEILNFLGQFN